MVAVSEAFSCGPAGPIGAIVGMNSLFMVVIEALKKSRMLTKMEIIGLILGTFGSVILSVPEWFE